MKCRYLGPNQDENADTLLDRLHNPPSGIISVDTETISLKDTTCIGIGIAPNPQEAFYIPVLPEPSEILPQVMGLLNRPDIKKLYHSAYYDLNTLRDLAQSEQLPEPDVWNIEDTATMAKVTGHVAALEDLGRDVLGIDDLFSIQELLAETRIETGKRSVNMLDVDIERVGAKCSNDIRTTWQLFEYLNSKLTPETKDCYEVDRRLTSVLQIVQQRGLALRKEKIEEYYGKYQREANYFRAECDKLGFNPASPQQVGYMLAVRGTVLPYTKSRKGLKTDKDTLRKLDDPLAHMILAFRVVQKLLSSYIIPWRDADRAYTHFRLDLATGRLASFLRNLQNVPPGIRDIFRADSGMWTWADLNQIEMRTFAWFSQDPVMMKAYADGIDIHGVTAELFPDKSRDRAKTFNFAMIFGGEANTLADKTGLPLEAATTYRNGWLSLYEGCNQWMKEQKAKDDDCAETLFGRQMLVPTEEFLITQRNMSSRSARKHIDSCRINYPIQGTAADKVKRDILYCWDNGIGDAYRLQVHDEHLLDGDIEFPEELNHTLDFETPYDVKRGMNWEK